MNQIIRVLLCDEHTVVRQGLQCIIDAEADMQVVAHASSGDDAEAGAREHLPDVVLMEVSMRGSDGFGATERIRRECHTVRIIALTRHDEPSYVQRMFDAGATGYVVKRASAAEVLQAIRVVASGNAYLDEAMTQAVAAHTFGARTNAAMTTATLTEREAEVLRKIARGHSNKEVAEGMGISIKTVEYHKARSCSKLSLRSRADIVKFAIASRWMED